MSCCRSSMRRSSPRRRYMCPLSAGKPPRATPVVALPSEGKAVSHGLLKGVTSTRTRYFIMEGGRSAPPAFRRLPTSAGGWADAGRSVTTARQGLPASRSRGPRASRECGRGCAASPRPAAPAPSPLPAAITPWATRAPSAFLVSHSRASTSRGPARSASPPSRTHAGSRARLRAPPPLPPPGFQARLLSPERAGRRPRPVGAAGRGQPRRRGRTKSMCAAQSRAASSGPAISVSSGWSRRRGRRS